MPRLRSATRREREHGQILVLFALVLVVVMAFTALVIDIGLLRNDKQTLVNAMDSGALAGGTMMPVDGSIAGKAAATNAVIAKTVAANYPGITGADYTITYRCLIGADPTTGAPLITRDIPAVCNPSHKLGHAPVASDFHGAGRTRWSLCDPLLGDVCNTVVVEGTETTQFSFGRVVGVGSGSTGTVTSAACNGPCGEPPQVPLDVVLVLDRTYSMVRSGNDGFLAPAAKAVLSAYDPTLQRIALGFIGPSKSSDAGLCPGSTTVHGLIVTPAIAAIPGVPAQPGPTPNYNSSRTNETDNAQTSLTINAPGTGNPSGDLLLAQILYNNGSNLTIVPPNGWTIVQRKDVGTGTLGQAIFQKRAGNNEPNSYTWNFRNAANTATQTVEAAGGILRYEDVNTATAIDVIGAAANGTGTAQTAAGFTTAHDNSRVVAFFGHENDASMSTPTSTTERYENLVNNSTGQDLTVSAIDDGLGTAGDKGPWVSTAGSSDNWIAQSLALRAGPGTPAIPGVPGVPSEYGSTVPDDISKWIPIGLSGVGAPINESFKNPDGSLRNASQIVTAINCFDFSSIDNGGYPGTQLASPIAMARSYLNSHQRTVNGAKVKQGIILETDGQPENANPVTPDSNPNYTCLEANKQANLAKADEIEIYTIGFGSGSIGDCPDGSGAYRNKTAAQLLADMASRQGGATTPQCNAAENSDNDTFYCATSGADLKAVFTLAATDLAGIRTHLVQLYPVPRVAGLSQSSGLAVGGNTITVTGKYFTGATAVRFGGTAASTFTVVSDTSLTVRVPPGTVGRTVDVTVTTPGGTSPTNSGDQYTYN